MPQPEARELTDLHINESSGVDKPAHLVEGWMVLKNKEPMTDDKLAELLGAASVTKHDIGTGATPPPTGATPPVDARAGAETAPRTGTYQGSDYAECVKVSVETDGLSPEEAAAYCRVATQASAPGGEQPVSEQVTKDAKDQRIADLEAQLAARGGEEDPVAKALREHEVPEAIQKAILDSRKEAAEATAVAKAEREARVNAEWTEVAKGYRTLSADPAALGPVLKRLYEASPDDFNVIKNVLAGAEGALRQSSLFTEFGMSAVVPGGSEPQSRLEAMAKAKAEADSIPYEKALELVASTPEGRELYKQYVTDREAR